LAVTRPFHLLDAFGIGPFTGNPLAVMAGAEGLPAEEMQAITRWLNLSETAGRRSRSGRSSAMGRGTLIEDPVSGNLNASVGQWLFASGRAKGRHVAAQGACLGRTGRIHLEQDESGQVGAREPPHALFRTEHELDAGCDPDLRRLQRDRFASRCSNHQPAPDRWVGTGPVCTDLTTKPGLVDAGVRVIDAPLHGKRQRGDRRRLPCRARLAAWIIARGASVDVATRWRP
jgi:hypothetical protein